MLSLFELSRLATALGGLPVPGCQAGSPAGRAGLRYGDILLSIDGIPTPAWIDFLQARSQATAIVRVFRNGREFEVAMDLPVRARSPREVLGSSTPREPPMASATLT